MDSHTERHEILSESAQKFAEDKARFNNEVRAYISDIAVALGNALAETLRASQGAHEQPTYIPLRDAWDNLANRVCNFTEFLDAN